jgi:chromosome segregation protein
MHITRLRLIGFKSFVEPTELLIETGLTGVVGPNGCGKSNLLEALRWAMGETSYKAMRASAMDDVIFAGTTQRPARSWAEVTMFVDNRGRTAPAEFNDHDVLEVTRRIEREMGSAYRVNGREVRARDVKVLFEDAATGARSPALVRQGQIGEIVNAKPEQRRRILEDAAGVAGLHTRRHEAELRLKAAEDNLARIGDVLGGLSSQLESLKRQARHARRYRELSAEIRSAEALALHVAWVAAGAEVGAAEAALREALVALGAATEAEADALAVEAEIAGTLPGFRDEEATRAVVVARLRVEQETFEKEADRLRRRQGELDARVRQLDQDLARERGLVAEAAGIVERLADEAETIVAEGLGDEERLAAAVAERDAAEGRVAEAEARLADITRQAFEGRARRQGLEKAWAEMQGAIEKSRRGLVALDAQRREIAARLPDEGQRAEAAAVLEALLDEAETLEAQTLAAEETVDGLSAAATAAGEAHAEARMEAGRLAAEVAALSKVLSPARSTDLPPVLDLVTVAPGYEMALGAALGDDLDAPVGDEAGIHWRLVPPGASDAGLPKGTEPLAPLVTAPPELARRLAQVGMVAREAGARLQKQLKPGQRLVSREGDLWRWDGLVAPAEAPSPAAVRLAERNRLAELSAQEAAARPVAEAAGREAETTRQRLTVAEGEVRRLRHAARERQVAVVRAREAVAALDARASETGARLAAVDEARARAQEALDEASERLIEVESGLETIAGERDLEADVATVEAETRAARGALAERREAVQALERERRQRAERLQAIDRERARWLARGADGGGQLEALEARRDEAASELETLADLPAQLDERRQRLTDARETAERDRRGAADRVAAAEAALRQAQQALRAAQTGVAEARESRARTDARLEGARARLGEEGRRIRETLDVAPEACLGLAGLAPGAVLPAAEEVERRLVRLRAERDRLGGVNLNAEDELGRLGEEHARLDAERQDVEAAVDKLRGAIGQINREAKKRLGAAFKTVDGHFQRLFGTLFGGGEARLEMVESEEDPLEGGLEIIAKPPGKKPATLSLLSGGEQTLTALSLIFAVFLTNPSPICVLDEVDAPLDDSNVDRFCTLMERMASETATRFLVITHHPMTMARMNRLFGVTMGEKGVSQLVSVDLATAERIVDDDDASVSERGVA